MKQPRVIIVTKCGIGFCPYCIPDDTRKSINYCGAFKKSVQIEARVKTFPLICPLKPQAT